MGLGIVLFVFGVGFRIMFRGCFGLCGFTMLVLGKVLGF